MHYRRGPALPTAGFPAARIAIACTTFGGAQCPSLLSGYPPAHGGTRLYWQFLRKPLLQAAHMNALDKAKEDRRGYQVRPTIRDEG